MVERTHVLVFFIQPTFYLFLLQGEVLGEVVLNGRDDRLKFEFSVIVLKLPNNF